MPTITATPDTETAAVALYIDDVTGITDVTRTDANGSRNVRLRAGGIPAAGPLGLIDHEAALSGRIRYRLRGAAGGAIVWTSLEAVELPRFTLPYYPSRGVIVEAVNTYAAGRRSRSVFHEIIDREDTVANLRRLEPRVGSLEAWFPTYAAARDLEILLDGQIGMYRQREHPGLDMYFHTERIAVTADDDAWRLTLDYREAGYPAGAVLTPSGWTFAGLTAAEASFYSVADKYDTFTHLEGGRP